MATKKKRLSRGFWQHAETKISAGSSRITRPAELNSITRRNILVAGLLNKFEFVLNHLTLAAEVRGRDVVEQSFNMHLLGFRKIMRIQIDTKQNNTS